MAALHWSRRRFLSAGTATLTTAVAGCASDSNSPDAPSDPGSGRPDGAIPDVPSVSVRHEEPTPFVSLDLADENREMALFLIQQSDVGDLSFDRQPPDTADAREFVRGTDFETASVVVVQAELGACFRRHVEYVVARDGYFDAEFCALLRDADVRCETDDRDMVATFLRVPFDYGTRPSSVSFGSGSDCESAHPKHTPSDGGSETPSGGRLDTPPGTAKQGVDG